MSVASVSGSPRTAPTRRPPKREWAPRMWQGLNFQAWARLLVRNRCAVTWRQAHTAGIITFVSMAHSALEAVERLRYRRIIAAQPPLVPPVFIIGHWRTGTTLLHELLALDERHTHPNTYECLEPNHFLLTESIISRWGRVLMPSRRPMDNMSAGWDRPQEDEFALCMMGQPSPYLKIAFPNRGACHPEYLDLETLAPRALESWKDGFLWFLERIAYRRPGRLILKSPTHSCRIRVLKELFPDARFVHILRDPYVVFPSTVHLWKSLYETHGLQIPRFDDLNEYVLSHFVRLHEALDAGRPRVEPSRYHELRYEDLVRDPVGEMRAVYEHLELGDFEPVRPALELYAAEHSDYETNRYELTPEIRALIDRRWGPIIQRQGYARVGCLKGEEN